MISKNVEVDASAETLELSNIVSAIVLVFIVISLTKTFLSLIKLKALTFFEASVFLYIAIILMNYKETSC